MSYATEAAEISREPIELLVLTLDYCANTFGVAPCTAVGECCYNTYKTCKDWANFSKTTKDYKFTSSRNATPFKTGELPYLKEADYLPCEIKDTITVNSRIKATLLDEPWPDVGTDPYITSRASAPNGTYWRMLLARNPNYYGRLAKLYRGFYGMTEDEMEERYVGKIKSITYQNGLVTIELVDMLKNMDDIQVPAKVDLEIVADMTDTSDTMTLSNSTASGLSAGGGYLRIKDEIIYYAALDATSHVATGLLRARFNTVADSYDTETSVQPCRYYSPDNPFDILLEMLETDASIDVGYIDTTAFASAKADPGTEINFSALISEPTDLSDLFWEIVKLIDCKVWIDEGLKITICHNLPNLPSRTYHTITESDNIVNKSGSINSNDEMRKTRIIIYWDWDMINDLNKASSHSKRAVAVDAEAESANEYNDVLDESIYCRWIRSDYLTDEQIAKSINNIAARYLRGRRDAMALFTCKLELKDYAVKVGDYGKFTTSHICGTDGNIASDVKMQITRKAYGKDNLIEIKAQRLPSRRICIIAPPSYSSKTYSTATETEREYGAISDSTGRMANGDEGYRIY
jgi:hypothetical protein